MFDVRRAFWEPMIRTSQRESSKQASEPAIGLAEADVIDILRGRPGSGGDGPENWDRIVGIVADHDGLSDSEVKVIEKAVAGAYRGWPDANRRKIWYETASGVTDDDDSLCDTS